MTFMKQFTRDK